MQYATLRGEKTIGELVNRLYQLPEGNKLGTAAAQSPDQVKALIKKAEDELRVANPALANIDKIPPGLVLIVPPVRGLNTGAGALKLATAGNTIEEIKASFAADLATLNDSAQREKNDALNFVKTLDADPDWKPLQKLNAFEGVKTAARTEAEQRGKNMDAMLGLIKQISTQIDKDMKDIDQVLN